MVRLVVLLLLACVAKSAWAAPIRCLPDIACGDYDIILVAGQSNATSRGIGSKVAHNNLDNDHIWQLGRRSIDGAVIPAFEPMEGASFATQGISFALPFARHYRNYFLEPGRRILIIPTAYGGSSVVGSTAYWGTDGLGTRDAQGRLAGALSAFPDSRLVAVLWHQGETDYQVMASVYADALRSTLTALRPGAVPLVMGQLADAFVAAYPGGDAINQVILATATKLGHAVVVSSAGLQTDQDNMHFTGDAQYELGRRYLCGFAYLKRQKVAICDKPWVAKQ